MNKKDCSKCYVEVCSYGTALLFLFLFFVAFFVLFQTINFALIGFFAVFPPSFEMDSPIEIFNFWFFPFVLIAIVLSVLCVACMDWTVKVKVKR